MLKLSAIFFLEADFNMVNKILFNTRLISNMKGWEEIPREIIGDRKGQSAIYVEVDKKLVTDIAN